MTDIDQLLLTIEVPPTDVEADVRRGEAALRRRHRWQVAAAAAGVAAVGVAGFVGHGAATSPGSTPRYAGQTPTATPRSHASPSRSVPPRSVQRIQRHQRQLYQARSTREALRIYHDVLAEHLDPQGTQLRLAQNEQGGTGVFGTKLDWRDGGMLEIVVGRTWQAASSFYPLEQAHLAPYHFPGHEVGVSTAGDDLVVSVRHRDGTVVTLIASTAFGNNGTSTAALGLTRRQLVVAAADPRLVLPRGF